MTGNDVRANLRAVLATLPESVTLVAVSKFHPDDYIMAAYDEGQRTFGESREQEMARKHAALPKDIRWHFIGHLQTNKVKQVVPYITMIESVDSFKLLKEIDKQAAACGRQTDVLLEIHIAQEATKYGFAPDDCRDMLDGGQWRDLHNVRICGVMAMASLTDDEEQIKREFAEAAAFFDELKAKHFADSDAFRVKSWGMSDDYPIAVKNGSNMVRVGTKIFGPRVY